MNMKTRCLVVLLVLVLPLAAQARAIVVKQVLGQAATGKQLLTNGDLERLQDGQLAEVKPWEKGYEVDQTVARSGKVSARIAITDVNAGQHGLTYPVVLNQQKPVPFTAELWSKAQDVSGTPDSHYSLYLDLTYMDGTPLWGQISPFAVGTHDWQKRTVTVVPEKPVREVSFHAIFRSHTGTAWFDDFVFSVLDLPAGAGVFDGIPVVRTAPGPRADSPQGSGLGAGPYFMIRPDGQWDGVGFTRLGGLFVRDAKRKSDFRQPLGRVTIVTSGYQFEATDEELGLKMTADYANLKIGSNVVVRVDGTIENLTGEDRGVSVYCSLPLTADTWHDDMRTGQQVKDGQSYSFTTQVGCGANGKMSLYPFGCVTGGSATTVLGAPLDPPYLYRFGYDAASHELFGVEDLGLTKDSKTPQKASFSFVLYRPLGPGFRGALDAYYKCFPNAFTKRTTVEGNWMAFDHISAVQHPEDFYFAFKEGTNDPDYDEAHGILTYTYVEPASYWMAMGDLPRTPQAALELLAKQAAQQPPLAHASATMTSGVKLADGGYQMSIEDTPWCNGALFILNPDPDIPTTPQYPQNQGMLLWKSIRGGLGEGGAEASIGGWGGWDAGYQAAAGQGRGGSQAALLNRPTLGAGQGLSQLIPVRQEQPGRITVRAWCKAEGVTGERDKDFSIYCDLTLANGQPSWGHSVPFNLGTYDWEQQQVVIDLPERVNAMSLHLLFRGNHTGRAWFDDVSVTVEGSDNNLVANPGLEPKQVSKAHIDGTYIDSLEMASGLLDFDRRHWRAAEAPLVYTTADGLPTELLMFGTYEFIKDVSEKMHAEGRTIFANAALHRFAQCAGVLDVMGTETNWNWQGKYTPMTDATCNFKRALCYQRPYLLLQNTVLEDFPVALVEKYMQRAIFYGLFPSFFSHNASERTYWTRPDIYNRDRHLFKKYLPVAQAISAAGWEPMTFATTGNPKVYVERWGEGDHLYFTLFNDSDQPQEYSLQAELNSVMRGGKAKGLQNVIAGQDVPAEITREGLKAKGTLGAEQLRVLRVVQ
jgi:hypothetical protein